MNQLLISFGSGMCFAFGVMFGLSVWQIATKRGRDELKKDMAEHYKRVEDRLARQVDALLIIAENSKPRS